MSQFVEIWTLRLFHEKEHVFTCIHLICKANLSNSNSILYPHSDLHVNISIFMRLTLTIFAWYSFCPFISLTSKV